MSILGRLHSLFKSERSYPKSGEIQQQLVRLHQQGIQLYQQGRYEQAIGIATQVCGLARQHFGEGDPRFATSLHNLAELYRAMGNYAAAEPLYRQALDISLSALGQNHPDVAQSLGSLAVLYHAMSNYEAAESLFNQALEIQSLTLGEDHPSFAKSLNNLAAMYRSMGNYVKAEPLYRKALEIDREVLGEKHPDFATVLNNLAVLYEFTGNYEAARPLIYQALEIRREVLGETHPEVALSLTNLAELYRLMGNYASAEPLYHQALEIYHSALGEKHPNVATSLNNLAALYRVMGSYAAAEPLYRQAVEIYRSTLGVEHPDFARGLNNLAALYEFMANYTEAEPLLYQAMVVRHKTLGENHPDFAQSLNNLAGLYRLMDSYEAAEPLYRQAIEVYRTALGEKHPDFANSLGNLAELCYEMGNYTAAEPLYHQAIEIQRTALGEKHPDFADSLNSLATLCIATARENEALTLMEQAAAIRDGVIGQIFSIGSESQRLAHLRTVEGGLAMFLSLVSQHLSNSPTATHAALELVLRRKAIGAEALAAQRDAVLGGKYPFLESKLWELTTLRMQIAQRTLAGPGSEALSAHHQFLMQWNAQKEKLEAELARQVPEMNLEQKLRAADRQAVTLALSESMVLVEFVRFDVADFKAVPAHGESRWKSARYLAFVLPAGEPDNLQMVDLGEAKDIDQMIATFRLAITGEDESRGKRDLGALPSEPGGGPSISEGAVLRAALFDKLLPAIDNRKRLLLAPDGDLTRLPFEALPTDDGRRLIDDYQISYLGVGRDVLRFGAASSGQPAAALVAADPDFDLSVGQAHAQTTSETAGVTQRGRVSRETHTADLKKLGRLPGTRVEGERIARMLGVKPLLGEEALEARIKACRSPRILHLATHGFFLADQRRDPNRELRGLGLLGGQAGDGFGQMSEMPSGRMSGPGMENPLLRSGVVLAGFKTWLKGGSLPAEAEDGLLTAEDVSGLDLLATELVVLSACETGLGEVRTGEGVFGLRRAFVLAGAKTLVMSLWKVPDLATAILMERFYDNLLNRRDSSDRPFSRSESLREAQFHTRDITIGQIRDRWLNAEMIERLSAGDEETRAYLEWLTRRPDNYCPFTHPKFWGAFICQGDPGPMPSC